MKEPSVPVPVIDPSAVVAPGSHIHGQVVLGERVFVLFGVVMRAELDRIEIGAETNVQDNAVLHCDQGVPCLVGERVTIGHSAVVHAANVGNRALIGIGAKVLNRSTVGEGAWVAAGSVLAEGKEIPPWTLAMGIPARPVRPLTDDEIAQADEGVGHYLDLAEVYGQIFAAERR